LNPIADPAFYLFAVPAVAIMGIGKGGFGGTLAMVAMPLMALSGPPAIEAGAIMFPILLLMDAISLWFWRSAWSRENVALLLPGAVLGTALGYLTAAWMSDAAIRLMLGVMSLAFCAQTLALSGRDLPPRGPNLPRATLWSTVTGFTSFISHVGGPPLSIYLLPQRLPKEVFAGTMVVYFAITNLLKIGPLAALGVFTARNLWTSAMLAPVAILATATGVWLVRRISTVWFYRIMYALLFVVALKLTWDGATGLLRP
jgi:uncharacterized protein